MSDLELRAAEIAAKLAGRRVVASVSGGKDSAAMSLHLRELGIEHERVFMDTGWEHEITYRYLREVLAPKLGPIRWLQPKRSMQDLVQHKGMFPSRVRRFCTQELKVFPLYAHLNALIDAGQDVVNAVGIRREESTARARVESWEWSDGLDAEVWRPILDWTFADVVAIHKRHGLEPNPLYLLGASRVGCWPCIFARKDEIRLVADTDPARIAEIRDLERQVGDAADARAAAKGIPAPEKKRPTFFGPTFFGMRKAGERTRACAPIDEVVAWSKTSPGGRNFALFRPGPPDEGCMRWGLCDTSPEEGP